jgi:hypothetical protein
MYGEGKLEKGCGWMLARAISWGEEASTWDFAMMNSGINEIGIVVRCKTNITRATRPAYACLTSTISMLP